jgi:hypothetical protein
MRVRLIFPHRRQSTLRTSPICVSDLSFLHSVNQSVNNIVYFYPITVSVHVPHLSHSSMNQELTQKHPPISSHDGNNVPSKITALFQSMLTSSFISSWEILPCQLAYKVILI